MKKSIVLCMFILFSVMFMLAIPAMAQDDQFVLDQQAKLQARLAKAASFLADPPAQVFHSAAILGISDREYLIKVLGEPIGKPRYENLGCTLILEWPGLNYSEIYPKMSGISQTPIGIEFIKSGTGWMLANAERMDREWIHRMDSYGSALIAKK